DIRGIYRTWPECEAKVKGVRGARYQAVASREQAEAMLRGEGTALTPGVWAFVDGNHLGGVGVVVVQKTDDEQETVLGQGGLTVTYRHQRGHQAAWAGRDDFAHYNGKADGLATEAGHRF